MEELYQLQFSFMEEETANPRNLEKKVAESPVERAREIRGELWRLSHSWQVTCIREGGRAYRTLVNRGIIPRRYSR